MFLRIVSFFSILLLLPAYAASGRLHHELYYQTKWCAEHNGKMEVRMGSGARCDCLTDTHAIEFDFANKWAEAIGQSLHYAAQTGKLPGIVLIIEDEKKDTEKYKRLVETIEFWNLPIDVWIMKNM